MNRRYQHDHDEELSAYWYSDPPRTADVTDASKTVVNPPPARLRDRVYWLETGSLVREYLKLQAGADYSEMLRQGFVTWLKRWPAERRRYVDGNDMTRAALADWYLKVVLYRARVSPE
jgi:hypothetical protein